MSTTRESEVAGLIDKGAAYFEKGEFSHAEEAFSSAATRLKGKDSSKSEYADTLQWIGQTRTWLGKFGDAELDLTESRRLKAEIYGPESKEVACVDLYHSDLLVANQEFQKGHDLAISAITVIEKEVGSYDLAIADAASRVGIALAMLGRVDESAAYLNRALGIRRKKLGEDNRLVGRTLDQLSQCHAQALNFTMAGALGRKALKVQEAALGDDHPDVGVTLLNLATQYVRTTMFEKGEPIARRAVEVLSKRLPAHHPLNIRAAERLGTVCMAKFNTEEALELHKKALAGAEKVWGKDDPNIISNLVGLASVQFNRGDFISAESYLKRSLSIMEKGPVLDTSQEYSLLTNLSCCYLCQLKIGDMMQLVPASFRAQHTAYYGSNLNLIRQAIEYFSKQIDAYRKDQGDY